MLQGLLAPWRLVMQRSLAEWLIVAATWLVVLCATTLLAIGVLYGDAVALTGLRRSLADESSAATTIAVQLRARPEELGEADDFVSRQLGRVLGWTGGELARIVRSESYALPGQDPEAVTDLAVFGAYGGIEDHATLMEGRWPAAGAEPMEAALSAASARALGLEVGDEVALASRIDEALVVRTVVAGIWQPDDPQDAYWRGEALELDGVAVGPSFTTFGPFVAAREDVLTRTLSRQAEASWRALPNFERLAVENVNWMRSDTAALDRRLSAAFGRSAFFEIDTELDAILDDVGRSLLVSRSGVLVLTMQFAVLAGYALVLVAGLLVEQRRVETALLRSRGAAAGHVALMAFLEAVLLVAPAVLIAPFLAATALELLNAVGPLSGTGITIEPRISAPVLVVAALAGLGAIIGLVLPAFASGRGLAAVRQSMARQSGRSLAQRMGFDLALVVLAGVGLWQLRQYGAPLTQTVRGTFGLDPLLVAAPAIGLLAGAILALRIVPLAAEIGERLLSGRRGLVAPLGARQLSRRPLRYTRSALLLILAAALGTFAGAYAGTWTQSQAEQAAYQAGADVRVQVSNFPDLPQWAFAAAYDGITGVEGSLPVVLDRVDVGSSGLGGQLLAIDAGAAPDAVAFRPDLADEPLTTLMSRIRTDTSDLPAVPIPGEPSSLAVTVDVALEPTPLEFEDGSVAYGSPLPQGYRGVGLAVVVRDARGILHRFEGLPSPEAEGGVQEGLIELTDADGEGNELRPDYPLDLVAVELVLTMPENSRITGQIAVLDISAAGSSLDLRPGDDGWRWVQTVGSGATAPAGTVEGAPERVAIGPASPILGSDGPVNLTLKPDALDAIGAAPVPVLAGDRFLELTGVGIGDELGVGTLARRTNIVVAGELGAFPTLDPEVPFAVADLATLALAEYARAGVTLIVDEWWLSVPPEESSAVAATLRLDPYSADAILVRDQRRDDLLGDPVALGLIGALGLGSAAAVIFAAIGFVVSATVSTRERMGEFALLRALGLSPRQLSAWLSLEHAFLLAIGLLAGTGLGLLLAWVVLPFVTLTQDATAVVPPVQVIIPWGAVGLLYALAAVAFASTMIVIANLLRRVRVSGVLRAGED